MKNKYLLSFVIVLLSLNYVKAQFLISGEFRPKIMYMDGYKELRNETKYPYGLITQRSRLSFDYTKDNISYNFSIQDVRAWGQDAYTSNNNSIGIFEAYINYSFCKNWAVKLGRQQLKYDDERLLSVVNWRDYGATHDIGILKYKNEEKNLKVDAGAAVNNPVNYQNYLSDYTNKNYKFMAFLWANKYFIEKKLETSLIGIADINQKASTINKYYTRYTFGPYLNFKTDKINVIGSTYYQTGKLSDGKSVSAFFYAVKAGYKINKKVEIILGYEHYSGNDNSDTIKSKTESTTFDKLYGTGHTFLGYMDYFSGNASDITKGAGINDLFVRLNLSFNEKNSLEATYHIFNLDKKYLLTDKFLGSETDILYTYKQSSYVNFSLGYSFFIPSETMEKLHGYNKGESKYAQFAYIMLTFKPQFLNIK